MARKLKATAVALTTAVLIIGVTVPSASAEFHSTREHPLIFATQSPSVGFTAGSGFPEVTCNTFSGVETWAFKTNTDFSLQELSAGSCKDALEPARTVHAAMNGCKYIFHASAGSGSTYTGTVAIECPAGNTITTTVTGSGGNTCTVTIPGQAGIGPIHYENGTDFKIAFQATNVKNTTAGGFFLCGLSNGEHASGTFSGGLTITASNTEGVPATISASAPPPPPDVFEVTSTYTSKSGAHGHTSFSADQTTAYAFTAAGGAPSVSCEEVGYEGTSEAGEDAAIVVSPSYVGCEDSLGRKADIEANGCVYELTPTKEVSAGTFSGTADIECGAKPIEIKITNSKAEAICTITIGSQNEVGPVHFTNMTATTPTNLTIGFEATNVANTTSGGSTPCGVADGAHQGSYKGGSELDGESCVPADVAVKKE